MRGARDELRREASTRLEVDVSAVGVELEDHCYIVTVTVGSSTTVRRKIRATFWDRYVASGGVDNCHCVDHFFDHLRRQLAGAR